MTKISQLSDIGSNIAADDEFIIRDVSDASTPNKKVTVQYIFDGFLSTQSIDSFSDVDTTTAAPVSGEALVWNGSEWVPGSVGEANKITDGAADEAVVEAVASGLNGYINTTISGANSARTTISGYFENASGVGGTFYPVVTQVDIGTAPNEVPLNGMLGTMAYQDSTAASVDDLVISNGVLVTDLPSGPVGMIARVTDATTPAVGSTVTGGGAAAALCWYNGTNWTVIGV